jgi:3',5'-cyclic AMP phosphodiesterase CpdA
MKLWAISDLHLGHASNRRAVLELEPRPDDWLAVAGDVGETEEHLRIALDSFVSKFARVLWVPGNHELWTDAGGLGGQAKYERLVAVCRERGVLTPEDPYHRWPGSTDEAPIVVAPLFLLYDYTFGPDDVAPERAVAWAAASGIVCADEARLDPSPYASRAAWCAHRCEKTCARLEALPAGTRTVLINHFPLRREHAVLRLIPRFSVWCGTRTTEDWHTRFRAVAVVSGHLHIRSTRHRDGVRFEEVSLGYPPQWDKDRGADHYLRQILPTA